MTQVCLPCLGLGETPPPQVLISVRSPHQAHCWAGLGFCTKTDSDTSIVSSDISTPFENLSIF